MRPIDAGDAAISMRVPLFDPKLSDGERLLSWTIIGD
jgi:hypothetical protein